MAAESPHKSGSRVFETQVDEGKPTGFLRYINVIAITVPILIGVILVVVIARSLSGPARPASAGSASPSAGAGSAGWSTPIPKPAVAAAPTPSSSAAPAARVLPAVAATAMAPVGALKPVTAPVSAGSAGSAGSGDPTLTLAPEATAPMRISGDEVQVPLIAKIARAHGTMVLDATISKAGTVEDLKFVSGPPLLESAAMAAVRTYRYQPILSDGKPVRVRTQVILIFNLAQGASQSK